MTPSSSDAPETAHRAGGVAWAGLQFAAIAASLALCAHGLHSRAVLEQALWSDPAGAAGEPLHELVDELVRAVRDFEAGGEPSDDLTVLALRLRA